MGEFEADRLHSQLRRGARGVVVVFVVFHNRNTFTSERPTPPAAFLALRPSSCCFSYHFFSPLSVFLCTSMCLFSDFSPSFSPILLSEHSVFFSFSFLSLIHSIGPIYKSKLPVTLPSGLHGTYVDGLVYEQEDIIQVWKNKFFYMLEF